MMQTGQRFVDWLDVKEICVAVKLYTMLIFSGVLWVPE